MSAHALRATASTPLIDDTFDDLIESNIQRAPTNLRQGGRSVLKLQLQFFHLFLIKCLGCDATLHLPHVLCQRLKSLLQAWVGHWGFRSKTHSDISNSSDSKEPKVTTKGKSMTDLRDPQNLKTTNTHTKTTTTVLCPIDGFAKPINMRSKNENENKKNCQWQQCRQQMWNA